MAELIKIYEENPSPKEIAKVVEVLKKGGLVIYPTDTVYGLGCDLFRMLKYITLSMNGLNSIRVNPFANQSFSYNLRLLWLQSRKFPSAAP